MSGRAFSLLVVVTTLSGVGSVPYLLELKALRVGLNLVPLPLIVWSGPQEVIAEAIEALGVREDLSTSCVCIRGSTQNQTQAVNLPLLHSSQIWCKGLAWRRGGGQRGCRGWRMWCCGCKNWGGCTANLYQGCLFGSLLPEPVCPRSITKLPCGVGTLGHSCWKTLCSCVLW